MLSMPRTVRPDSDHFGGQKLVSPLSRQLAGPLSETKNRCEASNWERMESSSARAVGACVPPSKRLAIFIVGRKTRNFPLDARLPSME